MIARFSRMVFVAVVIAFITAAAPVLPLTTAACNVQPSAIAVSVGENFTINCTFSCDDSYITLHWLRQDHESIFDVLPSGSVESYETQTCGSSNTGNRTYELWILASDELRTVQSIVCAVEYEDEDTPCIASACVEVTDEATDISNSTTTTDAAENSCDVPQIIDVVRGEFATINCTISCDTPPETVHWLAQNDTAIFAQSTAIARDPPESCDTSNIPEVTHQLVLKATNESAFINIRCIASIRGGGDFCVTSVILNIEEPPYTENSHVTMDSSQTQTTAPTTSPSSELLTTFYDSSYQMASSFGLVVLLLLTVLFAV